MKPFEGILGNNCELRLLEFMLPLEGLEFNMSELAEESGVSRPMTIAVVRRFVDWGIIKKRTEGRIDYYSINENSPFTLVFKQFNDLLIGEIVGEEVLSEVKRSLEEISRKEDEINGPSRPACGPPYSDRDRWVPEPRIGSRRHPEVATSDTFVGGSSDVT